jgi:hypothetical protein
MTINYSKKHTIQLIAIVMLGAPCVLTSCADQNSTAKTSSRTVRLVTANSGAIHGDPKTDENIRKADDYRLPPGRAEGQPYNDDCHK